MSYYTIHDFMKLNDKQKRQLKYLQHTLDTEHLPKKKYSEHSYKKTIDAILTWNHETIIKLTLYDKRLIHACNCPKLDNYWKKYLKLILFDCGRYEMKPRKNIKTFYQAASTMYWKEYLLSTKRTIQFGKEYTELEEWLLQRAAEHGSWHACDKLIINSTNNLLSSISKNLSEMEKIWELSQQNAQLHLTSGYFSHALLCAVFGKIFSKHDDIQKSDMYYLQCVESFQLANLLTTNKESQIAIQNAYYGKEISQANVFEFKNFNEAFKSITSLFNPSNNQLILAIKNAHSKYRTFFKKPSKKPTPIIKNKLKVKEPTI